MGVAADDIGALEAAVAADPGSGVLVRGLGGIRKVRFRYGGRGKRGGGRAIYFAVTKDEVVFMLLAYAKNEKADLTSEDRRVLLALVKELTDG